MLFKEEKKIIDPDYVPNTKYTKAKIQTFDKTRSKLKKVVHANKTALGQVKIETVLVKEEVEEDDIRPLNLSSIDGPEAAE